MIRVSKFFGIVLSVVLFAGAAQQSEPMPAPTTTEYFKTKGGGFISGAHALQYALTFKIRKAVNGKQPWFATIEYENPENASAPIVANEQFSPSQKEISIRSPELKAIKNRKTYSIKVFAYADSEKTKPITTHEMFVRFDVPDEMAATFGVKML